jgi:hypothetical protein
MMKSRNHNSPVKEDAAAMELANSESKDMAQEEEADAVCALLRQVADRDHSESASFAYPEEMENADYVDKEALHRIVEDLQFGHDLRL